MKVELLRAWDDNTWDTDTYDIPREIILNEDHGEINYEAITQWAHRELIQQAQHRSIVMFAVYNIPEYDAL